ncbi:MAG: YceI family protein [Myxococcota bacterium]
MKTSSLSAFVALTSLLPVGAAASTWNIDSAHASAQFSVRHMMVTNVRGELTNVTGTLELDDKNITKSTIQIEIDAATIDTRNEKRDGHLKSPEFLDVAKFPKITFKSTKIRKAGKGKLKVTGNLTIRGVTKSVILDVEGPTAEVKAPWGAVVRGLHATTTIKRKEFGLTWNKALEAGGILVGEEVKITLDIELVKQDGKKT